MLCAARFWLLAALIATWVLPSALHAEPRSLLAVTTQFHNDHFGDGRDRGQTGGYRISVFQGPMGLAEVPMAPFEVLEFRIAVDVRSPDLENGVSPQDRLYAGTIWAGVHTHFEAMNVVWSAGADLGILGEQSGIRGLHNAFHEAIDAPSVRVGEQQVEDALSLLVSVEGGRVVDAGLASARPFVEVKAGSETLIRTGVDLAFSASSQNGIFTRDPVTGHRSAGVRERPSGSGVGFEMGADAAYVLRSVFLPENRGPALEPLRLRARTGLAFASSGYSAFLGVTYLSEEFQGQGGGQLVGSFNVTLTF